MQRQRGILSIRLYIIAISAVRTLIWILASIRGFNLYFPRIKPGHMVTISIIILIMFWVIAIFYNSIKPFLIWVVFLLDGLISYFYGLGIYREHGIMNIYEGICFGNVIIIIVDILLIVFLIHRSFERLRIGRGGSF
ncbi:MAG: hypothetical protein GX974_08175 [Clostridiales bacterium]|nr:hypothetical protein [Clostridiales bacterium]